jgi:uncharacterized protein YfkK (UPF0435 family)
VYDLSKTSIVQAAWKNGQDLSIHGWVYGLNSGFVTDLKVNISSNKELDEVYQLIYKKNRLRAIFYSISKFSLKADSNFGINFINIGNNKLPPEVKDSQRRNGFAYVQ